MEKWNLTKDTLVQEMDDQVMVYLTETGLIHVINQLGGFILRLIESGHDKDAIIAEIRDKYVIDDKKVVEADIEEFLTELVQLNIIEIINE